MSVLRHWKQLLLWSGVVFLLFAIAGNTYRAIDYRVGVNESRADKLVGGNHE